MIKFKLGFFVIIYNTDIVKIIYNGCNKTNHVL